MTTPQAARLYNARVEESVTHGHDRRTRRRSSRRHRIRTLYFVMASVWGLIAGTAAILAGLVALGRRVEMNPPFAIALLVGLVLALIGGWVASTAYRESTGR